MQVRVLGSSGGCAPGCPPTSFLVNGKIVVDAGAAATSVSLEDQMGITDVLLTHSHLDHVRDLPFLLINVLAQDVRLRLHATQVTIDAVRRHLFNKEIWFAAFETPSPDDPVIDACPLEPGTDREIAGVRVHGFPLRHTVESTGWLMDDGTTAVYFAGDTDEDDVIAAPAAAAEGRLKVVFLECSFPDEQEEFAKMTGHLTPAGVGRAARDLPDGTELLVTHVKPGFEEVIRAELAALGNDRIRMVDSGEVLEF